MTIRVRPVVLNLCDHGGELSQRYENEPQKAEEGMPLQLTSDTSSMQNENKNAAAIAWVEQWYATPDDQPPGYWDEFEEILITNPITFGDEDLERIAANACRSRIA